MSLEYKGYMSGPIEFDDGLFHGVVAGLRDVVTFAGATADELAQAFRDSIDDYLAFCAEEGLPPDRPFSGNFMVRVPPRSEEHPSELQSLMRNSYAVFCLK